jgi:hypothetical protein
MTADSIQEIPGLTLIWDADYKRINETQYLVMLVLENTVTTVSRIRSSGAIKSREFLKILPTAYRLFRTDSVSLSVW